MIIAAADGSALGNPGPAGWAWYVDDDNWGAGGWAHATNNRAELRAVLELFRATAHTGEELLVQCDSQYVINTVTRWAPGWKRRGWKKSDGKPVLNLELIQEIDAELAGRAYRFEWVRGHIGHELNEAADTRARAAAEAFRRGAAVPAGPGWTRTPASPAQTGATGQIEALVLDTDPLDPEDDEEEDDALFALDEPAPWRSLALELSAEEHERLLRRARDAGLAPEEFLRGLI